MNIYKISQSLNCDYDTYDSAVVIAESEDEARKMHPALGDNPNAWEYAKYDWVKDANLVTVELIGTTEIDKPQVVVASFNAG